MYLFLLLILSSLTASASCPDFSGQYSAYADYYGKIGWIEIYQADCKNLRLAVWRAKDRFDNTRVYYGTSFIKATGKKEEALTEVVGGFPFVEKVLHWTHKDAKPDWSGPALMDFMVTTMTEKSLERKVILPEGQTTKTSIKVTTNACGHQKTGIEFSILELQFPYDPDPKAKCMYWIRD